MARQDRDCGRWVRLRYADGNLRPVYLYPADLVGHTERVYHPGA